MSDLDEDLLALAGGADGSDHDESLSDDEVLAKKVRHHDADGDDDDDGENDDDDDEGEFDEDGDADDDDNLNEELVNPYPLENKYKDEADRAELEAMDEMSRESILYERAQEMQKFTERKYLVERVRKSKQQASSAPTRSSTRTSARSSKDDKLSELKKQREKKRKRDAYEYESDEDDQEEEEEEEEEFDEEDDYDDYWGGARRDRDRDRRSYERATVADIAKICVGRSMLAKYWYYKGYADTVIDCYGRINLDWEKRNNRRPPQYRLVKIIDVINRPEKAYNAGSNGKLDVFLKVSQNRQQQREFPLPFFSDSPPTADDFDRYVKELEKTNESIDYVDDVNEKEGQLRHLVTRGMDDDDINEKVAKKQKIAAQSSANADANLTGYDAVTRKAQLNDELKVAKQQSNMERAKELAERIARLDEVIASSQSSSQSIMAKLNERNRKLNSQNIRKAEIKDKVTLDNTPADDTDPFSRLKTTTRVYYQEMIDKENKKAIEDAKKTAAERQEEQEKKEEEMEKSTYRVSGEMDKLIGSIDVQIEIKL
ncbi:hypothetical protein DIURU_002226 [Diutina rugosa]|uniref:Plus3 domain-containing protein n=1 Tax=Diutina rugosa TaxID=5481 RepID=A0A642UXD2_DIURU|nr:uncharacterized protein DIURU_002226 [Diutina rugosa]KAA8903714.1 hypothetical protein DIURU_002226 [Diutina rugosa]